MYLVFVPLACVLGFVLPDVDTASLLFAFSELAKVLRAVFPRLVAFAMLHTIFPHASVKLAFFFLSQNSVATKNIHGPSSFVRVFIRENDPPLAAWFVEGPIPFENCAITILHRPVSVSHTSEPLTGVK